MPDPTTGTPWDESTSPHPATPPATHTVPPRTPLSASEASAPGGEEVPDTVSAGHGADVSAAPTSPGAWDARSHALLSDTRETGEPSETTETGETPETPETGEAQGITGPAATPAPAPRGSGTGSGAPAGRGPAVEPGDTGLPPASRATVPDSVLPLAWRARTTDTASGTPAGRGGEPRSTLALAGPADPAAVVFTPFSPPATGRSPRRPAARRGPADPVRGLMYRHRELCARAVDALEIAAGLEAYGMTDRTAARFRHRDVFSLAEELYARVPRGGGTTAAARPARVADARAGREGRTGWALLVVVPGIVCTLTLLALEHSGGQRQLALGLAGALLLPATLAVCLRRGPLRADRSRTVPAAGLSVYGLLAYLLCGDGLLEQLVSGGPDGPWPASLTPLAALSFAVVPAAWCAHLFSVQARRRLTGSRGLADFAAGARPLLLTLVALYVTVLGGLVGLLPGEEGGIAAPAHVVAVGTLLFLARLVTVHGFPAAAATALTAAVTAEVLACASVLAGRLPGLDLLAVPVARLVQLWGSGALPTVACGGAALALLGHAAVALARASAHT